MRVWPPVRPVPGHACRAAQAVAVSNDAVYNAGRSRLSPFRTRVGASESGFPLSVHEVIAFMDRQGIVALRSGTGAPKPHRSIGKTALSFDSSRHGEKSGRIRLADNRGWTVTSLMDHSVLWQAQDAYTMPPMQRYFISRYSSMP